MVLFYAIFIIVVVYFFIQITKSLTIYAKKIYIDNINTNNKFGLASFSSS